MKVIQLALLVIHHYFLQVHVRNKKEGVLGICYSQYVELPNRYNHLTVIFALNLYLARLLHSISHFPFFRHPAPKLQFFPYMHRLNSKKDARTTAITAASEFAYTHTNSLHLPADNASFCGSESPKRTNKTRQ